MCATCASYGMERARNGDQKSQDAIKEAKASLAAFYINQSPCGATRVMRDPDESDEGKITRRPSDEPHEEYSIWPK